MKTLKLIGSHLTVALTLAGLSACAVGPDYQRPRQALAHPLPNAYPAADTDNTQAAMTVADAEIPASQTLANTALAPRWWTLYADPQLNDLVERALKDNANLALAAARLVEARALLDEVDAAFLPQIDLGLSRTRSRTSSLSAQPLPPGTPLVQTGNRLAFSTAFEIDVWGKLRRASESAQASFLSTVYARDVVQLTLISSVVQNYLSLNAFDVQTNVLRNTVQVREDSLRVAKARAQGGLTSALDVRQAESALADAALQLNDTERQRQIVQHSLGTLLGDLSWQLEPTHDLQLTMATPPSPPAGLPSELLDRRPDIRQAEQNLIAANAEIGVAKAARLPSLSLTANYGGLSEAFADLLKNGARFWSAGLTASLPIFDAGKYAARTRQAEARQQQALVQYRQSIETGFREVADALTNLQRTHQAESEIQIKRDAARDALRLAQLRYKAGYSPYLDVLDAQRTANDAEIAWVQQRLQVLSFTVDVMKALGGGWQAKTSANS